MTSHRGRVSDGVGVDGAIPVAVVSVCLAARILLTNTLRTMRVMSFHVLSFAGIEKCPRSSINGLKIRVAAPTLAGDCVRAVDAMKISCAV